MRHPARTVRFIGGAIALVCAVAAAAAAGEIVRVGEWPARIYEKRNTESHLVATAEPGSDLQVLGREGEWIWVLAPPDGHGTRRAGWINRLVLATAGLVPVRAAAESAPVGPQQPAIGGAVVAAESAPVSPPPATNQQVPSNGYSPASSQADITASRATGSALVAAAESARRATAAAEAARRLAAAERSDPAREATKRNAAGSGGRSGPSASGPPAPAGGLPKEGSPIIGEWIVPRALRASVGASYQSASVSQASGSLDDRLLGGGGTVVTSFAFLDPRILSIDFAGDFQASRTTSQASLSSFRNASGLQSYRVDVGILSGRRAPLRVYADRVSSTSALQPSGATLDPLRRTRGVRNGVGFTWDLDPDPSLPRVQISASTGRQLDQRDYLFGYSSTNDERRAEVRAGRDYRLGRYDLHFTHGAFVYDVPAAGVRSDTGSDVVLAAGRLTPTKRLTLDLHGRGSRFRLGTGSASSTVSGAGADAAVRYQLPGHFAASGRYSFSNNALEAALSGRLAPGQPGVTPVTSASQLKTRTLFQDGEGRVEYATRSVTAAAIMKGVSFDVPASQAATLTALSTGGGLVRAQHAWHGLTVTAGADGAYGVARSNQPGAQPYREAGLEGGLSQDLARTVRFGVDGSARRVGRLAFFPVTLDSKTTSLRFETTRPAWARVRASVTRFDGVRDILLSDARDRHVGYSLGLGGTWYDLSADINQADSRSLLLAPEVLGSRPEVAVLIASRPDLFQNLLAAADRTRAITLQLRPASGLQLQARLRRQEQSYPDLFGFRLNGGQAGASYQVRELQIELGWESFDSRTSFGNVRDRRVYVRVRRDIVFF